MDFYRRCNAVVSADPTWTNTANAVDGSYGQNNDTAALFDSPTGGDYGQLTLDAGDVHVPPILIRTSIQATIRYRTSGAVSVSLGLMQQYYSLVQQEPLPLSDTWTTYTIEGGPGLSFSSSGYSMYAVVTASSSDTGTVEVDYVDLVISLNPGTVAGKASLEPIGDITAPLVPLWQTQPVVGWGPPQGYMNDIGIDDTGQVIVGAGSQGRIVWSKDGGRSFQGKQVVSSPSFYSVRYGGGYWVAVGGVNMTYYATDPAGTWTYFDPFPAGVVKGTIGGSHLVYQQGTWLIFAYGGAPNYTQHFLACQGPPTGTWSTVTSLDGVYADYTLGPSVLEMSQASGRLIIQGSDGLLCHYTASNPLDASQWKQVSSDVGVGDRVKMATNGSQWVGNGFTQTIWAEDLDGPWSAVADCDEFAMPNGYDVDGGPYRFSAPLWDGFRWHVQGSSLRLGMPGVNASGQNRPVVSQSAAHPGDQWEYDGELEWTYGGIEPASDVNGLTGKIVMAAAAPEWRIYCNFPRHGYVQTRNRPYGRTYTRSAPRMG